MSANQTSESEIEAAVSGAMEAITPAKRGRPARADPTEPKQDVSEIDTYLEMAKKAQESRKAAPLVVAGKATIPQKLIIKRVAESTGGQDAPEGYHYWFADHKTLKENAMLGNQPVMENGELVRHESDVLLATPTWMVKERLAADVALSNRRLNDKTRTDNAMLDKNEPRTSISKPGSQEAKAAIAEAAAAARSRK